MIVTVNWHFVLSAYELMYIFVWKGKNCYNCAENIRHCCAKFSQPGNQMPNICTPLGRTPEFSKICLTIIYYLNLKMFAN